MMRKITKIALVIGVILLVIVFAYAFVDPVRAYMKTNWGPPLTAAFGSVHTTIVTSYIWQHYIIPFPNQALIIGGLIWIPLFILFLKSRTKIRGTVFRGAIKDSGMYPLGTKPISHTLEQPTKPAATTKTPAPTPEPEPQPEPVAPEA